MAKLTYTFKTDALFKMLFVQYPDLLKHLVAVLLGMQFEDIGQFNIINTELPPDIYGNKFCRLDINMIVNEQQVNLEIQVRDEGDFPERALFHWARLYSSTLSKGEEYRNLPRTVVLSIVGFGLFECAEFHSEFRPLEVSRHEVLTDRMALHFFELTKLPEELDRENMLEMWLQLFNAETEDDLRKIKALGVPVMEQAIKAYKEITVRPAFLEAARILEEAKHNEASALGNAERRGRVEGEKKGQKKVLDLLEKGYTLEEIKRRLEN